MTSFIKRLLGQPSAELPEWLQGQKELRKRLELNRGIKEAEFVAFDTELTGLDFKQDSIISIGAVKLRGSTILPAQTFYRLVKPECELKHKSVVVHELTHTDLECAEDLLEVIGDFVNFAGDAVFIGHFVHIDLNFLNKPLQQAFNVSLKNPALDTATLHDWLYDNDSRFAKHYQGMTLKSDLFSMAKKYGVEGGKSHNAFSDAYITAQLFQRFVPFLPGCGIKNLKELLKIARP
ncbi:MAG: 3'-5' exonuclease [Deltaproteobacteria bacterium]|jgi:DNA polymerase-3 subunit epsilon|nr:3'-5' exonuclease [Deltaproteobacteria bacterium]